MDIKKFQAIVEALLNQHFGIGIVDTDLSDETVAGFYVAGGVAPFEAVNAVAEHVDLARIDVRGPWGLPQTIALTQADQDAVRVRAAAGSGSLCRNWPMLAYA